MSKANYIIKRLNNTHREKVLEHFTRLDSESLYNRFCYAINKYSIEIYVEKINFDKDGIFGVFDDDLNIIGVGECVIEENTNRAEVGFSVEVNHQGQGLGSGLMERIVRFAKIEEKDHLEMFCLRTNAKSIHLAKKFGLKTKDDMSGETLAVIDMDNSNIVVERINENVDESFANYWLKQKENLNNWKYLKQKYTSHTQKYFFELMRAFIPGVH